MKKIILFLVTIFLISCETAVVEKVETNGEPEGPHTSAEWKIWAYSTAAPSFIAAECTVVDTDGTVLREGTNGWTAMSGNPNGAPSDPENGWKDPHEAMPMVGDAASFAWLQAFMAGEVPDVEVDGWAWMLHGDIGEDNRMYLVTDEEGIAKGFLSLPVKREGKGILPEMTWKMKLFMWVKDNAPESITKYMK